MNIRKSELFERLENIGRSVGIYVPETGGRMCDFDRTGFVNGISAMFWLLHINEGEDADFIRHYVREENVISLAEAVRKMTSLAAERIGVTDRGLIQEGMKADVVAFDPETIIDRSTFTDPHQLYSGSIDASMPVRNADTDSARLRAASARNDDVVETIAAVTRAAASSTETPTPRTLRRTNRLAR